MNRPEHIPQGTIRIDKEGAWFFNDSPIINSAVLDLFNRHIEPAPDGGYLLKIDGETCPLVVEDTPYVVAGLSPDELGCGLTARLNDGTHETFSPETLRIGETGIPYCTVKNGRFPARLLRPAWNSLALHIEEDGSGRYALVIGGTKHLIKMCEG